jgi:hypothetical protein
MSAVIDDPRYVVESDRSGKQAAHKPESIDRRLAPLRAG